MFYRLLLLNWRIFISSLNKVQVLLTIGYLMFLAVMLVNLAGTAILIAVMDAEPWMKMQIPWLTPEIQFFILLVFANSYWLMHFSFTNLRLVNIEENRKLLGFAFPLKRLALYMTLISFFHPINIIYNLTWIIFLMIQVDYFYQIPVGLTAILLNYSIIYSIKHRFIQIVERRFIAVVIGFLVLIFALFQGITLITKNSQDFFTQLLPEANVVNHFLSLLPGGLMVQTVTTSYGSLTAVVFTLTGSILISLFAVDHFHKIKDSLQNPGLRKAEEESSKLWSVLRKMLGRNAGKYYYYVMKHPYNRLQLLTLSIIPLVYVPLLMVVDYPIAKTILVPTILAGIPVAILAMGMANMYGYENRELLLHLQFPVNLEKQLKERFLGVVLLPLLVFYVITIFEILLIPEVGNALQTFIANTFFFLMFMLLFIWSSYYQYKKATYSSFSYKHPIIPQRVTFAISFLIFTMGYLVFVPLDNLEWYRLTVMGAVIVFTVLYLWQHMDVLVNLFRNRVLMRLWNEL